MKARFSGAAEAVGSHLVDALIAREDETRRPASALPYDSLSDDQVR